MTNAVITLETSILDTLEATRTSKSGKETTRTVIGMAISGNKEERANLAFAIAEEVWFAKGNAYPFIVELNRVFPTLVKTIEARNETTKVIASENPGVKLELVNLSNPKKRDVLAMFGVARKLPGADKGAKAQLLAVMQHLADMEDSLAIAKLERAAAFQATLVLTPA